MAQRYGTDHHEVVIDWDDLVSFLPEMVHHQDEPIADWVCVPLYYVSKLARDSGTIVVQVGEGSDEIFHGYQSYIDAAARRRRYWEPFQRVPAPLRRALGRSVLALSNRTGRGRFHAQYVADAAAGRLPFWGGAIAWQGDIKDGVLANGHVRPDAYDDRRASCGGDAERERPGADLLQKMTYLELKLRLAELLLMRVDKMTMATSVEARVPFLDHELVQFAIALPERYKVRDGVGKHLLKTAVDGLVDHDLVWRRKQGFGAPGVGVVPRRAGREGPARDPRLGAGRARPDRLRPRRRALGRAPRRPGVELPALEPLQRQRLVRPLGGRARARRLTCCAGCATATPPGGASARGAGTAAARRAPAAAIVRPPVHRARIRVAPPRRRERAVARALGGVDAFAAVRGPVRAALPTVVAWEGELEAERDAIVARAEAVAAHRFDLLGLRADRPRARGSRGRRDFKTGARRGRSTTSAACRSCAATARTSRCRGSSRAPSTCRCSRRRTALTGEARYVDELGAQLRDWIAANPIERGPNWACTMDVAIRAANWLAALALLERRPPWLDEVAASLLLHGRFIRSHLEWGEVRGNHYLSDVVGLLPVAALFSALARGARRGRRGRPASSSARWRHQVRADGCDHEMSIPYHRLVCELFVCGAQHAEALCPGVLSPAFYERLDRMLEFVADYMRPDGLAPQAGDADDGRYLPLGDYAAADQRDHRHLFRQAGRAVPAPQRPRRLRRRRLVRDAPRASCGRSCAAATSAWRASAAHAHNDQLSFELCLGDQPLVVDPGAYVYTPDPAARNAFRATAAHATLQVDGREQNPLRSDYLFALEDRAQARALAWEADGPRATFAGEHRGFDPVVHRRRVSFDGERRTLEVEDEVTRRRAAAVELPAGAGRAGRGGGRAARLARWDARRRSPSRPPTAWRGRSRTVGVAALRRARAARPSCGLAAAPAPARASSCAPRRPLRVSAAGEPFGERARREAEVGLGLGRARRLGRTEARELVRIQRQRRPRARRNESGRSARRRHADDPAALSERRARTSGRDSRTVMQSPASV